MIKLILYVAAISGIVACGATTPNTVPEVRVVEKSVPTPVRCIDALPRTPALEPIPLADITAQTVARVKREQALIEYSNKLKVLATPCLKDSK